MAITHLINPKESSMSSNTTEHTDAGAHKGGLGLYIALVPWVLFTALVEHSSLQLGSAIALVSAIGIAAPGVLKGRPKMLELGTVATFIGFVAVAFLTDGATAHWVARYARGIAAAILSLISFASLMFTPFTEQYARESVPRQFWGSAKFKAINRKLTTMWALVFAAMVPFHIIAGVIDTQRGNLIFNWAIPILLVMWGIKRSSAAGDSDADAVPVQPA